MGCILTFSFLNKSIKGEFGLIMESACVMNKYSTARVYNQFYEEYFGHEITPEAMVSKRALVIVAFCTALFVLGIGLFFGLRKGNSASGSAADTRFERDISPEQSETVEVKVNPSKENSVEETQVAEKEVQNEMDVTEGSADENQDDSPANSVKNISSSKQRDRRLGTSSSQNSSANLTSSSNIKTNLPKSSSTTFQSIIWNSMSCATDTIITIMFAMHVWLLDTEQSFVETGARYEKHIKEMIDAYDSSDLMKVFREISESVHSDFWNGVPEANRQMVEYRKPAQYFLAVDPQNNNFSPKFAPVSDDKSIDMTNAFYVKRTFTLLVDSDLDKRLGSEMNLELLGVKQVIEPALFLWLNGDHFPRAQEEYNEIHINDAFGKEQVYDLVCVATRTPAHFMSDCKFHNTEESFLQKHNLVSKDLGDFGVFHHGNISNQGKFEFKGNDFSHIDYTVDGTTIAYNKRVISLFYVLRKLEE